MTFVLDPFEPGDPFSGASQPPRGSIDDALLEGKLA
jgi:hypothetical protein